MCKIRATSPPRCQWWIIILFRRSLASAERLTGKPTVTSKQRRRQRLFNVQSNKRAGGGARTHNYFSSSSPVTANTPQIDYCFGGRKLYLRALYAALVRGVCALSYTKCAPVCGAEAVCSIRNPLPDSSDTAYN